MIYLMNPALLIIIVIAVISLWFLISWLFKPMGKFVYKIGKDTIDIINDTDENMNVREEKIEE